jgi:hypothetical protein
LTFGSSEYFQAVPSFRIQIAGGVVESPPTGA